MAFPRSAIAPLLFHCETSNVPSGGEVRQSVQVVSGIAREEAVGRPPIEEGTMSTAMHDPPTRLLSLPFPPVGPPSEPVRPAGPFSFDTGDTGRLLERLERLRSTAAGNSPHAPEAPMIAPPVSW